MLEAIEVKLNKIQLIRLEDYKANLETRLEDRKTLLPVWSSQHLNPLILADEQQQLKPLDEAVRGYTAIHSQLLVLGRAGICLAPYADSFLPKWENGNTGMGINSFRRLMIVLFGDVEHNTPSPEADEYIELIRVVEPIPMGIGSQTRPIILVSEFTRAGAKIGSFKELQAAQSSNLS